ncbi:MAG: sugar ABC transporter substrate-binding protein [Anaerolineae bacterium]
MIKRLSLTMLVALMVLGPLSLVLAQDEEAVELRWRTRPGTEVEAELYAGIGETIDAEWDGVGLTYEGVSENYVDVLITEIEAGTAPDVYWIPGIEVARFAQRGLLYNLNDLAAADEGFSIEDFYAGPMSFLTTPVDEGDALWGLPRDVSSFAIYYNATLFDEAGIPYPGGEDWTWERFYDSAEAIRGLGDEIYGFGMGTWWAHWGYWVNTGGGALFNDDYTACALDTEGTVTGLEFITSLYTDDLALPFGTNAEPAFTAGTLGMFQQGRWGTPNLVNNADFEWNVAPLPEGPGGPSNWIFWGAYVVNPNTEHPQEAWELLRRLTEPEVQGQIASLGANIPSRSTNVAIDLFLDTYAERGLNNQAFVDGLQVGLAEAPLFFGDWGAINQAYSDGINAVFDGTLTPQAFSETICVQVAAAFTGSE